MRESLFFEKKDNYPVWARHNPLFLKHGISTSRIMFLGMFIPLGKTKYKHIRTVAYPPLAGFPGGNALSVLSQIWLMPYWIVFINGKNDY